MRGTHLEWALTLLLGGAALTASCFCVAFMSQGLGPTAYLYLTRGVSVRFDAVLAYTGVIGFLTVWYGGQAVWALGLMWGADELVWNGEAALLSPSALGGSGAIPAWWLYLGFVCAFTAASIWSVRRRLAPSRGALCLLLGVLAYAPVQMAARHALGLPMLDSTPSLVASSELPWYGLTTSAVLAWVRR